MEEIIKIQKIIALADLKLLVEFNNGVIKIYDAKKLVNENKMFEPLKAPDFFSMVCVDYDGSGIIWNADLDVSEWELWTNGVEIPLTTDDLNQYQLNNSVGTAEACKLLNCSRQNIDFLTKKGKIHPVMKLGNNKIFSKSEIMSDKFRADNEAYAKKYENLY